MTNRQKFLMGGYDHIQELINGTGYDFITDKFVRGNKIAGLTEKILLSLQDQDKSDYLTRYTCGMPNITRDELETILYTRGSCLMFPMKTPEGPKFYYMNYALDSDKVGLDYYGRYISVHPIPLNNTPDNEVQATALSQLRLKVLYEMLSTPLNESNMYDYGVIIYDRQPLYARMTTPRRALQEPILEIMSNCVAYMNTSMMNSTGISGMRVTDENNKTEVWDANKSFENAAKTGQKWLPIVGSMEMQEFTSGNPANPQEFTLAMQSLDNLRLSMLGLGKGGIFEKTAHTLEAEQAMNASKTQSAYNEGLYQRQLACDIANSAWRLGCWYEASESATIDLNGDMVADDSNNNINPVGEGANENDME